MRSSYLLKLATKKKKDEQPQQRYVQPLAQIIAQQHGVNPEHLKNRDMSAALAELTEYAMGMGYNGACNDFARKHTILPPDDTGWQVLNSDYAKRKGYRGACDMVALTHKIVDPNVLKGTGQNVLSQNKYQDISNPKNLGKGGRNGGQAFA